MVTEAEKAALASTRELSRQWSSVVAGLTGILGLAGIAFGSGGVAKDGVAPLFFLALGFSAVATVLAALASYGTPPFPFSKSWSVKLNKFDSKNGSPWRAAAALWAALILGFMSFACAIAAVVIALT